MVEYNNVAEALRSYKSDEEILRRFLSLFSFFIGIVFRIGKAEKFDKAFLLRFSYGRLDRVRRNIIIRFQTFRFKIILLPIETELY